MGAAQIAAPGWNSLSFHGRMGSFHQDFTRFCSSRVSSRTFDSSLGVAAGRGHPVLLQALVICSLFMC